MKEKRFGFRESFYNAVKSLDDKKLGKLTKGLCGYMFECKSFETNDTALEGIFSLIKNELDKENFYREKGKQGGMVSAQMKKDFSGGVTIIAEMQKRSNPLDDILKKVMNVAGQEK